MSYPFFSLAATSKTASQHPCRFSKAAAVVAAPFLFINPAYAALNCTEQPTCSELGYKKTLDSNCEDYILCPFDTNYKACVSEDFCAGFTLSSCPSGANCSSCGKNDDFKYKIDSCQEGWVPVLNNQDIITSCVANRCPGYTLASCPENAICSSCTSRLQKRYKIDSCYQGYVISGNSCVLQCSDGYEPHDDSVSCSDSYGCSSYRFDPNNEWCSTCYKTTCPSDYPYCSKSTCQSGGRACTESPKMKGCYGFETLTPLPQCSDGYTFGLLTCPENSYGCTKREIDPQNSKCAKCVTSFCLPGYPYCSLAACEDGKASDQTCISSSGCYKRTTLSESDCEKHTCCTKHSDYRGTVYYNTITQLCYLGKGTGNENEVKITCNQGCWEELGGGNIGTDVGFEPIL